MRKGEKRNIKGEKDRKGKRKNRGKEGILAGGRGQGGGQKYVYQD